MKKQEMLVLSGTDRDRLKVLHEAKRKQITQREAGERLKVTERWVRALLARLRKEGDGGVVHRLRGRSSNCRLPAGLEARAVRLVKAKYGDFGPTLAAEYLAQYEGVEVSKETLRKWLVSAGVRRAKKRHAEEVHVWRARRSAWGELVQWDTSDHNWLEGRGPRIFLVAMIDDATSRAWARFVERDSTPENLRLLWTYLEGWGRPVEFYTDKDSLFTVNQPVKHSEDEAWEEAWTQIGRALRELGIGWIPAHSPQAKGRIERFFGTAQDRLVKGLRVAGVCTLKAANDYLEQEYLLLWNRRFTVQPANPTDAHRPLRAEHDLAAILSQVEERLVTNDYTIRYAGKIYQVARSDIRPGLRGAWVRVELRLDHSLAVRFRDHYLAISERVPQPKAAPSVPAPKLRPPSRGNPGSTWMKGFDLHKSPPLWKILKADQRREEAAGEG
jgi:DNA-binding Lrp family transcriptional regulator